MWELSVYMSNVSIYNPTSELQWQTNAFNPCVCCCALVSTVVGRWHSANCFMMIHFVDRAAKHPQIRVRIRFQGIRFVERWKSSVYKSLSAFIDLEEIIQVLRLQYFPWYDDTISDRLKKTPVLVIHERNNLPVGQIVGAAMSGDRG